MKTITITIEVYDASTVEDVERAVSAGLDNCNILLIEDRCFDLADLAVWLSGFFL